MKKTITEIVLESGAPGSYDRNGEDFDILRDAVVAADLADALNDPSASLTVFAPVDDAFIDLAGALGFEGTSEKGAFNHIVRALTLLGEGDPIPPLTQVLTYHVAAGELLAADVLGGGRITTLQGGKIKPDASTTPPSLIDADPGIANPGIIATDIDASNGVIHGLNGVLLPLSVTGILSQDKTDFIIGGNDAVIYETKGGADFVDAGGGGDLVRAGRGSDVVVAGNGKDIAFGGGGTDTLLGGNGGDRLYGGRGDDRVEGGAGKDTLTGGRGEDTFVFATGDGRDTIVDFRNGHDTIDLTGTEIASFRELKDGFDSKGFGTVIDLGDGDRLTLLGTTEDKLDAGDFLFA
ncbi:fasciclin domain-containing protein [Tropicimonas marinistellae]|uniref:fasciclin domain-containing protein n=1 Tax=Tropicimonas marinistellae TaxID=1739787 RepID=UPI000836C354|nr:fasciclin domain-containing protein [Tropicimonas marinistellae]